MLIVKLISQFRKVRAYNEQIPETGPQVRYSVRYLMKFENKSNVQSQNIHKNLKFAR